MTSIIFIENATNSKYKIFDEHNHQFGEINPNGYYKIKLSYNPNSPKFYKFIEGKENFLVWLGCDGRIDKLLPNNKIHLDVRSEEYNTRIQVFPPPVKNSNTINTYNYLCGQNRNKLVITPINNIFNRVIPTIYPPVPDSRLRLDFM